MGLLTPRCPVCGEASTGDFHPCASCSRLMDRRWDAACELCGCDLSGSESPCLACRDRNEMRALIAMDALGDWQGPLREWLSILKYGGDCRMAGYLAEGLRTILDERWPGIPVVPVPPRRQRMRRDGFDPVGALAGELKSLGFNIDSLLIRKGAQTQKGQGRSARLAPGALDYRLKCRSVTLSGPLVLLDDVSTTGATLETCASVLVEAGAGPIFGLVVCRD